MSLHRACFKSYFTLICFTILVVAYLLSKTNKWKKVSNVKPATNIQNYVKFVNKPRKILKEKVWQEGLEKDKPFANTLLEYSFTKQNDNNVPLKEKVNTKFPEEASMPKIVHFAWCGRYRRPFAFKNYLAVKSAYTFLQPDIIYFHCYKYPKTNDYEQWFNETLKEYPFIKIKKAKHEYCSGFLQVKKFIFDMLIQYQGVFVGEETIITGVGRNFWTNSTLRINFAGRFINNGYVAVTEEQANSGDLLRRATEMKHKYPRDENTCTAFEDPMLNVKLKYPISDGNLKCMYLTKQSKFYPKSIWDRNDMVGKILNKLMYGQVETPHLLPASKENDLIPNIAHLYWSGGGEMEYLFYLSCLSLLYVVKVDHLYIHGDARLQGEYWDRLQNETNLHFIHRQKPSPVWSHKVSGPSTFSDIFRADIMVKYGGIYCDTDVIWTQPIPKSVRRYDAVAALDWAHFFFNYPDYLNLGVSLGKPNSKFWKLFLESLKDYRKTYGYNGILKPYKVYERFPGTLKVLNELQVMCFKNDCHPLSGVNYTEMNWKKDTYAFHWTHPNPSEFQSESALLSSNSIFADIGKNVLKAAGLISQNILDTM